MESVIIPWWGSYMNSFCLSLAEAYGADLLFLPNPSERITEQHDTTGPSDFEGYFRFNWR